MPRLPDATALGELPSGRSGRAIATYDTSAIGEGVKAFGANVSAASAVLQANWEATNNLEAERRYQEFKFNEAKSFDDTTQNVQPGQAAGFASGYAKSYKERANEFAKTYLTKLPPDKRAEYDQKLFGLEQDIYGNGVKFERGEQSRYAANTIDDTISGTILPQVRIAGALPANDPRKASAFDESQSSALKLIDNNPFLTPIQKDEAKRKTKETIQTDFAGAMSPEEKLALDPANVLARSRIAIGSVESSNNYSAIGPATKDGDRAYGKYQVMGANIPEWTQAALGKAMTPEQFLADPRAQDAVFDHQFGGYLTKYGNPQDAASAWFTGKPQAEGANAKDITGTSGSQYVEKFTKAMDGWSSRLDAVPIDTRVALAKGADAELVRQQNEEATAAKAQHDAQMNDLMVKINDGQAGPVDVLQARKAGWLNDYEDIHKAEAAIEARDKDALNLNGALARVADPSYRFNPYSADDRKIIDTAFDGQGGAAGLLDGDTTAVMRMRNVMERSDIVPSSAAETIRAGIYSRDADQRDTAFKVFDGLYREHRQATQRAFTEEDIKRLQDYQALAPILPPDQLKERLDPGTDPQTLKLRETLVAEGRKVAADVPTSVILNNFDPSYKLFDQADAPFDPIASAALRRDYETVFAERYAVTPNKAIANQQATEQLSAKWGITKTGWDGVQVIGGVAGDALGLSDWRVSKGTRGRLMSYPPENYYPTVDGSHQWLADQLGRFVRKEFPDAQSYSLVPNQHTEAAVSARELPSYNVIVIDKDGAFRLIQDAKGAPALLQFDYAAEQAKVESQFKADRQDLLRTMNAPPGPGQQKFNNIMDAVSGAIAPGGKRLQGDFSRGFSQ